MYMMSQMTGVVRSLLPRFVSHSKESVGSAGIFCDPFFLSSQMLYAADFSHIHTDGYLKICLCGFQGFVAVVELSYHTCNLKIRILIDHTTRQQ